MTESSIYWDTNATGDGLAGGYTEAQMLQMMRSLFTAHATHLGGVAPDFSGKLAVSGASSPVAVAAGAALVYGAPYFNTAPVNVAVSTPAGATRIDRVVLRASWAAQTVRITLVAGAEGGAAPALTQSAGTTWDIPLAQISITTGGVITVTDERVWLSVVGEGAVTTAKIAADAVTNAKIADDSIDSEHYVDGSIDTVHIADSQITTVKLGADSVTNAKIADDSIDSEHYVDGSIDTQHIADLQVTAGKLADLAVATGKIADLAVTTGKIAADAVDGDKVGARVAQVHRRQGGDATNWATAGTNTYTPGPVRIQAGRVQWSGGGAYDATVTVTFPVGYSGTPLVFAQPPIPVSAAHYTIVLVSAVSTTGMTLRWHCTELLTSVDIFWMAIGPE